VNPKNNCPLIILTLVLSLIPSSIAASPVVVPSKDAGWLETLNYYRLSSDVEPVTENLILSANAMKHSIYLAKSDPKYFTGQYENPHSENPESPYYTIEGARSGTNLTYTARESDAIDSWMQAPLHAIGLLRDNLKTTGFATAINDKTGQAHTGLDVLNGLVGSRKKVVVFPGDGAIVRLNEFTGESPDPRESCGKDWKDFRGLPIFASLLNSPPRDITGKLVTPFGRTLYPGTDLCIVTQYSWVSTDRVISYGKQIMESEKLVLLIAKLPLDPGEYSVNLSGTGMSTLNWKFTVAQPPPKTKPKFDLDKRLISWDSVTIAAPNRLNGYTVIARDVVSNKSIEYRTVDLSLSTGKWTAGDYWLCVKVRTSSDESECLWTFARIFEKLPTVEFSLNSNIEEIIWNTINVTDKSKVINYLIRSWSRTTDKITDYPATGGKFSTLNWPPGEYWICVQAKSFGAESNCPWYFYTIDRKPRPIWPEISFRNPEKVIWDTKVISETTVKPDSITVLLRSSKESEIAKSESIEPTLGEWKLPSLKFGDYEICIQAFNLNGVSACKWISFIIEEKKTPKLILGSTSILIGGNTFITNESDVSASFKNYSTAICDVKSDYFGLRVIGLKAGACSIEVITPANEIYLANKEKVEITVVDPIPISRAKRVTIKCTKAGSIKLITGLNPKCPAGYKKSK
jgi:hypothetical protein